MVLAESHGVFPRSWWELAVNLLGFFQNPTGMYMGSRQVGVVKLKVPSVLKKIQHIFLENFRPSLGSVSFDLPIR